MIWFSRFEVLTATVYGTVKVGCRSRSMLSYIINGRSILQKPRTSLTVGLFEVLPGMDSMTLLTS